MAAWIAAQGSGLSPDRAETERFLAALEPDNQQHAFRTFSETAYTRLPGIDPLETALLGSLDQCWDELRRLHRLGASIAVTLNAVDGQGRRPENICRIRVLYADVDNPLVDWPSGLPQPQMRVQSSPGRYHLYWLIEGLPIESFAQAQASLGALLNADPKANAINQAMRLPGFWHRKNPRRPHLTRMIQHLSAPPYPAHVLLDSLRSATGILRPTR